MVPLGPVEKDLFIVGVTRMRHGVCVGAIDMATSEWVRPVKAFGELQVGDLGPPGQAFQMGDIVRFRFACHRPDPPHVEDWVWDPPRFPASVVRRPDEEERERLLESHCEADPSPVLESEERSMFLTRVDEIQASFGLSPYSGKLEARIAAPGLTDEAGFPCVDLQWKALGRKLTERAGLPDTFSDQELRQRLGYSRIYLAVGKGRDFLGQNWPLIGAVWLVPDYQATIDYSDL
jgi:hypothetical protein